MNILKKSQALVLREARMALIRKSILFRNEYRRIYHIDEYDTERSALINS